MRINTRALVLLAPVALAIGCVNADTEAPAAPRFDLGGSTLSRLPTITLAGSAEYGSALTLTREPAFDAAATPAATSADPYTARFSYEAVALAPGENTFTLVARDAAGNDGPAAKLVVKYDDVPAAIELSLSTPVIQAAATGAAGELVASARIVGGVDGFKLDGREVEFSLSGAGTDTKSATTDTYGRASASFSGLKTVGVGTILAKVKGTNLSDVASFVVGSGAPATLTLGLRKAGDTAAATPSLSIVAGTDVAAEVSVKDGGANAVEAPVQLFVDAPGALVSGLTLRKLEKAGTYHVVAAVTGVATAGGVAVSAVGTITVAVGAPAKLALKAPAAAVAGEPFPWSVALSDAYGNDVALPAGAAVALSAAGDAGFTSDATSTMATLTKAGTQVVTAALEGGLSGTASVAVVAAGPSKLALALSGADADPTTTDLEVRAALDSAVTVATTVTDRFDNPLALPATIVSDPPALFDGISLRGMTRAGTFTVSASVPNTVLAARKTFSVLGLSGSSITLALGSGAASAGDAVTCAAKVVDTFGNAATEPVTVSVDGLAAADFAFDATAGTLSVAKASATAYTVRARPSNAASAIPPATAKLLVSPGAPGTVTIDSGGTTTLPAGSNPIFTATVTDALGNVITNPPVSLAVVPQGTTVAEPPGPIVSNGKIYNLIRPGTYLLVAQVTGTSITNELANPNATLTVTAAEAASIDLVLTRSVAEVGSPIDFTIALKDAYGNAATGTPVVSVAQGATSVAPVVAGTSWTGAAAGGYTITATLPLPTKTLTDVEPVTITEAADVTGPTITFNNPSSDPTVAAWPPPGATSPAGCPGAGDVANVTLADPSLVGTVWYGTGGGATNPTITSLPFYPSATTSGTVDVCTPAAGTPARGEVLVTIAAADLKGNYRTSTGGWCVDADATSYLPANSTSNRCVIAKQDATLPSAYALAASDAGELVVAREALNGDAYVHLFKRASSYGLGTGHAITGFAAPRGVALSGSTAFTAAVSTTKAAIVRTRLLDKAGGGTDDPFVLVDSLADRFDGVVYGLDGAVYATSNARSSAVFGTKLYKFGSPLDLTKQYAALPTAVASSNTLRLTGLCRSPRATELYATGYTQSAGKTVPTVVRIALSSGTITTLFTDTVDGRQIGGCAATNAGVAVTLSKGSGQGLVTLIDASSGALASSPLLSGYAAASALDRPSGVAAAQGYLFALSTEGSASSVVRFARAGGF